MPRRTTALPPPSLTEPLLKYQQAADLLGVSRTTVRRLCYGKVLPHVKVGDSVRIRRADLEAYLAHQTVGCAGP